MKNLSLIIMLVVSSIAQCQTANIITEIEFNNIKINGVSFLSIKNTLGNKTEIENLFGTSIAYNIDPDGDFYNYSFNGFEIGFSSMISDGTYDNPIISRFKITNGRSFIEINNITIAIGSNISLLGTVVKNDKRNGDKNIIYMYCDGCNNYLAIDYEQRTGVITAITYIERT